MSRKTITAGDVAIDRATLGGMTTDVWPDDCPKCGARMHFAFSDDEEGPAARGCVCGTQVHRVNGRFLVIPPAADVAAMAATLHTTPENVRVLFSLHD